jgi:succinyl-CoA synthetase beta subunit
VWVQALQEGFFMKIHEYQAKQILKKFGVPVPNGEVAGTPAEAREIAKKIGKSPLVVKAQIHAGGRGKGGGIKLANTPDEVEQTARKMIGMKLVTPQTGPEGKEVRRVLVEQGLKIERELYLGIVVDRSRQMPVLMASEAGGMEIEEVARKSPEKILTEYVDLSVGFQAYQARNLAFGMNLQGDQVGKCVKFMRSLYTAFECSDASLAEINPLIVTADGDLIALDAKINFDDNALYRHKDIAELRDPSEEEPLEVEASKYDLNYIKLNGTVGCMVNGAGLAMATMDQILLAGGEPANFLDVGGAASVERVSNAFRILMSDPKVNAVLINIFGGIVRCDRVAQGVIEALKQVRVNVPVVVRLEGTNSKEAGELLQSSGMKFTVAKTFAEAARKVVAEVGQR